ncbi:MAG: hypothetical protein U0232_11980 [Thermomicrobiales bacterium]
MRIAGEPLGRWKRWGPTGWVALCGVLFGLAVQTHPGTVVLGPGLGLAFLWHVWRTRPVGERGALARYSLLVTRYSLVAAVAAVAAYAPVIIFNLTNGLQAVGKVASSRNYAYESNPSWASYGRNLRELVYALIRVISNPFGIPENVAGYLTSPYLMLMAVLCLVGLGVLARRGQVLPLCVLVGTLVAMPRFNRAYGGADADQIGDRYLLTGRYITYFLPLADVAIAVAVIAGIVAAWRALPRRWREPAVALPVVLVPLLVLYPLQPTWRYYAHEGAKDPNSASFMAAVAAVDAARGARTPVWLDRQLEKTLLNDGTQALEVLDYLLTLDRVPHRIVDDPEAELRRVVPTLDPADRESHPIVVMSRDRCWPLRGQIAMERISDTLLLNELFRYFAVYRWAPAPAVGECQPPGVAGR